MQRRWSRLILVWLASERVAWAADSFALPPGTDRSEWDAALQMGDFESSSGAEPSAALVFLDGRWVLRVRTPANELRTVPVDYPRSDAEREDLIWLARSMLRPGQSAALPRTQAGPPAAPMPRTTPVTVPAPPAVRRPPAPPPSRAAPAAPAPPVADVPVPAVPPPPVAPPPVAEAPAPATVAPPPVADAPVPAAPAPPVAPALPPDEPARPVAQRGELTPRPFVRVSGGASLATTATPAAHLQLDLGAALASGLHLGAQGAWGSLRGYPDLGDGRGGGRADLAALLGWSSQGTLAAEVSGGVGVSWRRYTDDGTVIQTAESTFCVGEVGGSWSATRLVRVSLHARTSADLRRTTAQVGESGTAIPLSPVDVALLVGIRAGR